MRTPIAAININLRISVIIPLLCSIYFFFIYNYKFQIVFKVILIN